MNRLFLNNYSNSSQCKITLFLFTCFSLLCIFFLTSFSSLSYSNEKISLLKSTNNTSITSPSTHWEFLTEYSAIYQVYYDDDLVGTANETLTFNHGLWKLEMSARLKKLFFKVQSNEFSEFGFDQQIMRTQRFYSKTKITFKKDKVIEQIFDWSNEIETGLYKKRSWQIPLKQQVFDRMSHTIQLRHDLFNRGKTATSENIIMDYLVSHKGKRENYSYHAQKVEMLNTPYGSFEAIKLERTKKNGDKFFMWLSPKLNYFPIKISQKEKGESEVSFLLKNFTLTEENEATTK